MSNLPYANLRVWKKAHELVKRVYCASANMPASELYGIRGQMRRSAASVATNIVEGIALNTKKEIARYIRMARASAIETSYHCLLARDLGLIDSQEANNLINEYQGLSAGLLKFMDRIKR